MKIEKNDKFHLCGGTFFILFTQAMKAHGRSKNTTINNRIINKEADASAITQRNLLKGLVKIYYPSMSELSKATEKSNATNFKKCLRVRSIPFDDEVIKQDFDNRIKNQYSEPLKAMGDLVAAQIDVEGKGKWLVKALLELIDKDKKILDDALFYVGQGGKALKKSELFSETHFCLEAFVLGVWHYCIMQVPDNTVGVDTYHEFYPYVTDPDSSDQHLFVNSIGENPSRLVELDSITKYYGSPTEPTDQTHIFPIIDNYYLPYFNSVAADISAVKTILFEETIKLEDFYVCNGIRRSFYRQTDLRDQGLISMTDNNPTIESVREFGLRIIIQAMGGMGKSMLMRHLMLDGIEQYRDTGRIPIYIRLKDYNSSNYEITDFIFDSIKAYYPSLDRDRLNRDISSTRLVLLLDGMDEIKSAYRGQFETRLNRFLAVNNRIQVIMSTRQFSKDAFANDFKIFFLKSLTKDQP